MPLKSICILVEDFPSKGRPVFVFVEQLVKALVDEGVDVTVIAPQSLTRSLFRRIPLLPFQQENITDKCNKYQVYRPYSLSFGNNRRWLYCLVKFFNQNSINRVLKRIKPNILYGHFWHSAYKLTDYAKKNKKPLFVACGEGDNALENLTRFLSDEQKKQLASVVSGVICVSTENKRKSIEYGLCDESKTIVLPNCVDTSLFHPLETKEMRNELGVNADDFVVVFTGAFIKRKGSKVLAEAIDRINDSSIKSIFIGGPLDGEDFSPRCNGIVFCGKIEHKEIPRYLNCGDVFVLPTLNEGCSNAIVEALACGIPVISSNLPFNDDILNENNSLTVNPTCVEEIAGAIRRLRTDKELYNELKNNAIANSSEYSIETRAKKIISFIESIIAS